MEIEILDISRGGAGVGKDKNGCIVFVPFTAPGDLVEVDITTQKKTYALGTLKRLIQSSQIRIQARCEVFTRCGGCQWQHLPYSIQWQTKSKGVLQALLQKKVVTTLPSITEIPAAQIWEYRNRIQLKGFENQLGYYEIKTHELVPISTCPIARKEINQELENVRQEGIQKSKQYSVEIEVLSQGQVRKTWDARHAANGFRQVHDAQNQKMINWIGLELKETEVLYDFFGGSGNLSLPFSDRVKKIYCFDQNPWKGEILPKNFSYLKAPVTKWFRKRIDLSHQKKLAIIDPPRIGLGKFVSQFEKGLNGEGIKTIVLIGCDLDSWIRDLTFFTSKNWKIEKIAMIDLFPQTIHIESIAVLTFAH